VEDQSPALESQIPSPRGRACQPSVSYTWDPVLCPPSKGRPPPRGPLTPATRHHDECVQSPQRTNETPTPRRMETACAAPPYYTFPLSLTPHPFMGLGKFMAGHIHQMRAQKRYLAAHPSWSRVEEPRHCPRCGEEEETFSHAILRCQSTSCHRERLLQGLSNVGPDSPL